MRTDVINKLSEFEVKTLGNQANIENAEKILSSDEKVLYVSPTNLIITNVNTRRKEKFPGIVFLTDKRFLFYYQILFNSATEIVYLDEIRSINSFLNSLTVGHIEIHTLTKTYDMTVSCRSDIVHKIQSTFQNAKSEYMHPTPSPQDNTDIISQIEKLAALKDKGILSNEEFQAKKRELLSRL